MTESKSTETNDYLAVDEITKAAVSKLKLDFLYRTHVKLHNSVENDSIPANLENAHGIIADEILSRGLLHHSWDRLDSIYKN